MYLGGGSYLDTGICHNRARGRIDGPNLHIVSVDLLSYMSLEVFAKFSRSQSEIAQVHEYIQAVLIILTTIDILAVPILTGETARLVT